MEELLIITYFAGMALLPILASYAERKWKYIFLLIYSAIAVLLAVLTTFNFTGAFVMLFVPVFLLYLFGEVFSRTIFRFLYLFINLIILGMVTNMEIYSPELTLVIFAILAIFVFLPYKKRNR